MRILLTVVIILFSLSSYSQGERRMAADSALFDFWVGNWELYWKDAEGNIQTGTNQIEKILDGKVLQEHFSDRDGRFKGTSISVYNPNRNSWHQAWADNQGGYFNFIGAVNNGQPVFRTKPVEVNDKTIIRRMIFKDIQSDRFTWDWQISNDGGEIWETQWSIDYERKDP